MSPQCLLNMKKGFNFRVFKRKPRRICGFCTRISWHVITAFLPLNYPIFPFSFAPHYLSSYIIIQLFTLQYFAVISVHKYTIKVSFFEHLLTHFFLVFVFQTCISISARNTLANSKICFVIYGLSDQLYAHYTPRPSL